MLINKQAKQQNHKQKIPMWKKNGSMFTQKESD